MKKRIKIRKKVNIKKKSLTLMICLLVILFVLILLNRISKKMTPIILEQAEIEVNKISTIVINKAISNVLEERINPNDIFQTVLSENGNIQMVDFNPIIVNQMLNLATTQVQKNLKFLESGDLNKLDKVIFDNTQKKNIKKGIIAEVPMGVVFKNSIFANIGPKIPIRLHYIGDVNSNIKTKLTPYGINNALVEVGINLEITAQIVLPFITKKVQISTVIPIAIKMIQGSIPNYYGNGLVKDSSLYSIPLE